MSKNKVCIAFKSIHQLWSFAQRINASHLEIITAEKILIGDCSAEDLAILAQYDGEIREMKQKPSLYSNR